jgi:hypothetical protein
VNLLLSTTPRQLADERAEGGTEPRWPHFARTTTLNVAISCAFMIGISAAQTAYKLVKDVRADIYGLDAFERCRI